MTYHCNACGNSYDGTNWVSDPKREIADRNGIFGWECYSSFFNVGSTDLVDLYREMDRAAEAIKELKDKGIMLCPGKK